MVKLWLGHANINTTHMYIEINMDLKRKILDSCEAPNIKSKKNKTKKWLKPNILKWLNSISKGQQLCEVKRL
jgi:integrase/recombinase XerD